MKTKPEFKNEWWMQSQKLLILQAFVLLASVPIRTQAASDAVDLSFDPGSTVNGNVNAIALQPDGKVLIGGYFTTVHGAFRRNIARLNADGSTDHTFLSGASGGVNSGEVKCLCRQNDGKIIIGGWFSQCNGEVRNRVARLNPDGSLDSNMVASVDDNQVSCVALQADGRILIGGDFTSVNGMSQTGIVRLNADGSTDTSFVAGIGGEGNGVGCLALQSDGKILVAGNFPYINGVRRHGIARLNPDGSLDNTFLDGLMEGDGYVLSIAIQSDGKVLVGGNFYSVIGGGQAQLARLNTDGSLDASFLEGLDGPDGDVVSISVLSDGRILIGGFFGSINGVSQSGLARLNTDGSLDSSFVVNIGSSQNTGQFVYSCSLQDDGRILIGGSFAQVNGMEQFNVARLYDDGLLDSTFANGPPGPNSGINSLALQTDGKILVMGSFTAINGAPRPGLARLNADGSLDRSLAITIGGDWPSISAIGLQNNGKILIGGSFESVNGVARTNIVRLNANGVLDESFAVVVGQDYPSPNSFAVQGDGKILVCLDTGVIRLNVDGSLDNSFLSQAGQWGRFLALQNDGKILVAGDLPGGIVRLNTDGSLDVSFQSDLGTQGRVFALALQSDGKILISGINCSFGDFCFARLNSDGTLDNSFLVSDMGWGNCIALQSDGKILVGGTFHAINGVLRNGIARLNPDGSLDAGFLDGLDGTSDHDVYSVAIQPDGKFLVGGDLNAINQIPRSFVARLMGEYAPLAIQNFPQSQTVEDGCVVDLAARVTGYPPPTFQWFCNGNAMTGCTNRFLCLSGVQATNGGTYSLVISNIFGAVTSSPAMLNVIPPVERRPVPGVKVTGEAGSLLNVDYASSLDTAANWTTLGSVTLTGTSQFCSDLTVPLPPQRFYRAWQTGTPGVVPSLNLNFVPAITLTGNVGDSLRVDCINAIGPTDAWMTLDTVTLTNTSQLYFDVSAPGQPLRLYRIVPGP